MTQQLPTRILDAVKHTINEVYVEVEAATELDVNEAIAAALGAYNEVNYPIRNATGERQSCDIVFPLNLKSDVWIETKLVWGCKESTRPELKNPNYRKSLLELSVKDVTEKLMPLLESGKVEAIGFLLIVFDSDCCEVLEADIKEFKESAGLNHPEWDGYERPSLPNSQSDRIKIRAYYWQRSQL